MPRRALLACLSTLLAATAPVAAQAPDGWRLADPDGPAALLAALRRLDLPRPGPLPMYAARDRGDAPAPLRHLAGKPRFEVLHFAPLYAVGMDRRAVIDALRAAARPRTAATPSLLEAALRATLPEVDRATTLPSLAAMVSEAPAPSTSGLASLQRTWDEEFAPSLRPFLEAEGLRGGLVIVSEHVGPDGRILAGRPGQGRGVIAVGRWASASPDAPLYGMLRELCYPGATRATAARANRASAERDAAFLAVQCGARLADHVSPAHGVRYRTAWATVGPTPGLPFDVQYPVDPARMLAIEQALAATLPRSSP